MVFPNATIHELGGSKTASHTTVVYSDATVTTVSTSLTPTAPPSSISIPSSGAIVSTDTTHAYGTHELGHHSDHELGQASDTDDEMETTAANINPTNFRGTVSENANTWLRYFTKYCVYKGYDDERSKALFKVLLTESAAVWFDSLQQGTQNDWTSLKTAFLARYTTPEFMKYKHANEPSPRRVRFNNWTDDRRMRYDDTRRDGYADYPDRRMGNDQHFAYDRSFSVPRNFSFRGRGVTRVPRYNRPMYGPSTQWSNCLLYTSPSPRDGLLSRMPSSA